MATNSPATPEKDPILYFLKHGVPMIGVYESGAYIAKGDDYRAAFSCDPQELMGLWTGKGDRSGRAEGEKIRRFRFEPGPAGFLCLDLDRGHEDGVDGVASFYDTLHRAGVALPAYLAALEAGSFPAYASTPSGGLHLYFRYIGGRRYTHKTIAPGVEAFHYGNLLTVPGSLKGGKVYRWHGLLESAPVLPPFIERLLAPPTPTRQAPRPNFSDRQRERPSLDRLAQWAIDDGGYEGRNRLAFEVARRASRNDYHYSESEVVDFLRAYGPVEGLPDYEIKTAVRSAFKGSRS